MYPAALSLGQKDCCGKLARSVNAAATANSSPPSQSTSYRRLDSSVACRQPSRTIVEILTRYNRRVISEEWNTSPRDPNTRRSGLPFRPRKIRRSCTLLGSQKKPHCKQLAKKL